MKTKLLILLIGFAVVGCSDDNENVEISPVMGDILKEWECVNSGNKTSYYLVKMGMGLNMKTNSPMFSDYNNPGVPVYGSRIKEGIKYVTDNSKDYYIIKDNGNLVLHNNSDLAKAIEVNSANSYQLFPSINRAFQCPCKLARDSVALDGFMEIDSLPFMAYSCSDKNGNLYILNALLTIETEFTQEEMIQGILASLDTNKLITYELNYINSENIITIDSPSGSAKMSTIFAENSTIHVTVKSLDSLDVKYNDFINSMIKYK